MIGRTQMTEFVEGGARGAAEHLIEQAEKRLRDAVAVRNTARAVILKETREIRIRKEQLRAAHAAGVR